MTFEKCLGGPHSGPARWNQSSTVRAQIVTSGSLSALKDLIQDPKPRQMTVSLHEEFASATPGMTATVDIDDRGPAPVK